MSIRKKWLYFLSVPALIAGALFVYISGVNDEPTNNSAFSAEKNSHVTPVDALPSAEQNASSGVKDGSVHGDYASKKISEMLNERVTDSEDTYEAIKQYLPELKEEIESYEMQASAQRQKVSAYLDKVKQRNKALAEGAAPESSDVELGFERSELLREAKELGIVAMALNEAIRAEAERVGPSS